MGKINMEIKKIIICNEPETKETITCDTEDLRWELIDADNRYNFGTDEYDFEECLNNDIYNAVVCTMRYPYTEDEIDEEVEYNWVNHIDAYLNEVGCMQIVFTPHYEDRYQYVVNVTKAA